MGGNKPRIRKNRNSVLRQRLLIAGLAGFLLFDVALVSFALTPSKPSATVGTAAEPVETTTPTAEPSDTGQPVVEPVETPAITSPPPNRILTALDASTLWRATTGGCPAATATPELSTDAGETWRAFDASKGTDASSILSIYVSSKSEASLVTLTAGDCTPQRVTTFVAGAQWQEYPDRVGSNWYVDPTDRATVHSPAGSFTAPCSAVIALAPRTDSTAALLCSDGTLFRTGDGAATYGPGVALSGAANLTVSDDGYIIVATDQAGCAGAQLLATSEEPDGELSPTGCREAEVTPGDLALASAGGIVWLWAGDVVSSSSDGGTTWQ
ncbi:hypothetical protein E3T37_06135 [Cryobacterium sp. TMT2-10]|uniref:hypothetical protein n=1 Tax=Cryobacterium sp. TMT2-10 TaxID=1259244 RepID=UPI00106CD74B|nr:hypothetical protein [Cryobacterium sp. TMT2-10]TFD40329.1 hypothetical protein E3T37_06135 [Cryobacterium sp. TMT2-10]